MSEWGENRPCVVMLHRDNSAYCVYGPFPSEHVAREWMDHQFYIGEVQHFSVVHLRTPFRERTRDDWWAGDWHQTQVVDLEFPTTPWFSLKGWRRWRRNSNRVVPRV